MPAKPHSRRRTAMRHTRPAATLAGLAVAALVAAACSANDMQMDDSPMNGDMDGEMDDDMDGEMDGDGMTMGDMAEITVAAEQEVDELPDGPLGWVAYQVDEPDTGEDQSWGPGFLYAESEEHSVEIDGDTITLEPGEAVFLEEGQQHTPAEGEFWAFLLTDPGGEAPEGLSEADPEFSSEALEGLPDGAAQIRFLPVDLPPEDGQTTVHTHPGPEYIHIAGGEIEYETGLDETTELTAGDDAPLPADTAVQKRNVSEEPARFWSWFVVDPDEPFSPEASFDR